MGLREEGTRVLASESDFDETPTTPRQRGRPRKKRTPIVEPPFIYQPNEASIKACVICSQVTFRILCRVAGWEDITDEEAQQIGEALDPVLQKRLPMLAGWGEEIALAMVLLGVIAPRLGEGKVKEIEEDTEQVESIKREIEIEPDIPSSMDKEQPGLTKESLARAPDTDW